MGKNRRRRRLFGFWRRAGAATMAELFLNFLRGRRLADTLGRGVAAVVGGNCGRHGAVVLPGYRQRPHSRSISRTDWL